MSSEFIPPRVAVCSETALILSWGADPPRQGLYWMCWSLGCDALTGPSSAVRTVAARAKGGGGGGGTSPQLSGEGAAEPHSKLSCCFTSTHLNTLPSIWPVQSAG